MCTGTSCTIVWEFCPSCATHSCHCYRLEEPWLCTTASGGLLGRQDQSGWVCHSHNASGWHQQGLWPDARRKEVHERNHLHTCTLIAPFCNACSMGGGVSWCTHIVWEDHKAPFSVSYTFHLVLLPYFLSSLSLSPHCSIRSVVNYWLTCTLADSLSNDQFSSLDFVF